jgi:hypothetical protein
MNGRDRPPEWPIRRDQEAREEPGTVRETETVRTASSDRSGLSWTTIALIGALLLLILLVAFFAIGGNPDQDKLTGTDTASENGSAVGDPSKLCASKATYESISTTSSGARRRSGAVTRRPSIRCRTMRLCAWKIP